MAGAHIAYGAGGLVECGSDTQPFLLTGRVGELLTTQRKGIALTHPPQLVAKLIHGTESQLPPGLSAGSKAPTYVAGSKKVGSTAAQSDTAVHGAALGGKNWVVVPLVG